MVCLSLHSSRMLKGIGCVARFCIQHLFLFIYVLICFGPHWVFIAASRLSLVVQLSSWRSESQLFWGCGIFPDWRLNPNPCLLHRQADSYPLSHQGSPGSSERKGFFIHQPDFFPDWTTHSGGDNSPGFLLSVSSSNMQMKAHSAHPMSFTCWFLQKIVLRICSWMPMRHALVFLSIAASACNCLLGLLGVIAQVFHFI